MQNSAIKKTGEKIGLFEKLGFGAYSMSLDAANNFVSTFLLFFFTDVLGITPGLAGVVMLIGTIWDGINDPLIGFYATNHRFKNNEVARPYAKWFALPTGLMFILLFTAFDLPNWLKFVYAVAIYLIYDLFSTFMRIPAGSMMTLATGDSNQRISLGLYKSGGSSIGVILATLGCWPLINALSGVDANGQLINPKTGFFWGGVVAAVIMMVGPLMHYATTRERVLPEPGKDHKVGVMEALKMLITCREWVEYTLYTLFYNISIIFVTSSIVYYATHVLKDANAVTLIMAAYILATMVALPFVGMIHRKLGRKKTMMLAAIILILSKAYFVISPATMIGAISNGLLVGIGVAFGINAFSTSAAEVADLIAWRTGKRMENMMSAISTTINKLGLALCTFMIGQLLDWGGYNGDLAVQPDSAVRVIEYLMGVIPMVVAVLMLVVACFVTIEKSVAVMNREKEGK